MDINQHVLLILILVPFLGFLFSLISKQGDKNAPHNSIYVSLFAIFSNIFILLYICTLVDFNKNGLQILSSYKWVDSPNISFVFGIDIFSLMIIMAIHLVLLISILFVQTSKNIKIINSLSMLLLSLFSGLLISANIFAFYVFFTGSIVPLFLLIGTAGEVRKHSWVFRFFIYNFVGSIVFLLVICALYYYQNGSLPIMLKNVSRLRLAQPYEYWIWGGIFIALLSRIPIWPFHYWIASINAAIQNPLVFLAVNLIPFTGVYGLIRFCPKTVPESVSYVLSSLEIIAVISMLFISMIGLINKDNRYKLFSFITVYYIVYLLGALLPTGKIQINIGYSLFAFLIIYML